MSTSPYPKIPSLRLLTGGLRTTFKPMLSSNPDPELLVKVRVGLQGDIVTHGYHIGLHDAFVQNNLDLTEQDFNHITKMYWLRIRTRLEMEAFARRSNLWWVSIGLKLRPDAINYAMTNQISPWQHMANGDVPEDELYLEVMRGPDEFVAYAMDHYTKPLPPLTLVPTPG
ncbi:hypothetical protein [Xanthomonas phage RTH11]|nr:hypothetical protein [Xanthomonas phage RTH11]